VPRTPDRRAFLAATGGLAAAWVAPAQDAAPPTGLVTGHPDAAAAGTAVLAAGGNAVDAAVAAALVAGVVALPLTGIGGYGGHLVLARPDGTTAAIDFNTTAPAAATPDMFRADAAGRVAGNAHLHGWLSAGVPGVLAGLQLALDEHGTKPFTELVRPAVRKARDGFPVTRGVAAAIRASATLFARDPGSAKLYLKNGEPLAEGDTFRNPDLAALLDRLAEKGRVDDFYTGRPAAAIAAAFRKYDGLVTEADLAAYRAVEVAPVAVEWRGKTVHTPPPTAGGLTVLQTLAALKALGWERFDPADPATTRAKVEALRVAWTDRLRLFGDPRQVDVPVARLLSDRYAADTAARVREALRTGKPVEGASDGRSAGGTIHLSAVDRTGLAVALTFTHGESFGARVTVDGLGLTLGHGVSRFDPRPGRANSVGPGKRPLHNMCPTVVTAGGKPLLAVGATGGRRIPNSVFDVLAYQVGAGLSLAEAVKAPRVHTEGGPVVTLEAGWPRAVGDHFRAAGYEVRTGGAATLNAIERDPATGALTPAAR
jgi:gamma-glutamyltranspeptidase/glutathione hydrolase